MEPGPQTEFADNLHATKYRLSGETFRECCNRIASELADSDEHFHTFRGILLSQRFLPGGRIQSVIGTTRHATPFNCYVSGIIADNLTGKDGILQRATEAAETMRMGGGIGYDFSTIRPRGEAQGERG